MADFPIEIPTSQRHVRQSSSPNTEVIYGKDAFQVWKESVNNPTATMDDFLAAILSAAAPGAQFLVYDEEEAPEP
jgi:hypothetical protein